MISGYLGPDLKVEGDVESKESIRIDGEYKGNINSQREVTIGPVSYTHLRAHET